VNDFEKAVIELVEAMDADIYYDPDFDEDGRSEATCLLEKAMDARTKVVEMLCVKGLM
jgi:hypothetical protein